MIVSAFLAGEDKLVPAISYSEYERLLAELEAKGYDRSNIHINAGFAESMILRAALGLSADQANILAIMDSSLYGSCAAATVMALCGAGGNVKVGAFANNSIDGLSLWCEDISSLNSEADALSLLNQYEADSHAIVLGVDNARDDLNELIARLNDSPKPVHTFGCPFGINEKTGELGKETLFASSTLALGIPFNMLLNYQDYVGRLYLCDIFLPFSEYQNLLPTYRSVFDSQPVIQLAWPES